METWRQSPSGRLFLEAAAVARAEEYVVDRASTEIARAALQPRVKELAEKVEWIAVALEATFDEAFPELNATRFRSRICGSLPALLSFAAGRAVFYVTEPSAAAPLLGSFLEEATLTHCDRVVRGWKTFAPTSKRRDRKTIESAARDAFRAHGAEYAAAWRDGPVPETMLPGVSGSSDVRTRFATDVASSHEGHLLRLVDCWRRRLGEADVLVDDLTACELGRFALSRFFDMTWMSFEMLTGQDLDDVVSSAYTAVMDAVYAREPITPFVPPALHGEVIVPPFVDRETAASTQLDEDDRPIFHTEDTWPDHGHSKMTAGDNRSALSTPAKRRSVMPTDLAVDKLFEQVIDASESDPDWWYRDGDEMVWVSGRTAQRWRANDPFSRNGRDLREIRVTTELLRVDNDDPLIEIVDGLASTTTLSTYVHDTEVGQLSATTSWTVPTAGDRDVELTTLVRLASLQAWESANRVFLFEQVVGLTHPAIHPGLGARGEFDPVVMQMIQATSERGQQPSAFVGAGLRSLLDAHPETFLIVNGDDREVVANVAYAPPDENSLAGFMRSTAMCTFDTTDPHPSYGSGLLVVARLPTPLFAEEVDVLAAGLNRAEMIEAVPFASTGSWCATPGETQEIAHVQFWPSAFAAAGLLASIATDLAYRALWAGQRISTSGAL
jgi:hypothetical protein